MGIEWCQDAAVCDKSSSLIVIYHGKYQLPLVLVCQLVVVGDGSKVL